MVTQIRTGVAKAIATIAEENKGFSMGISESFMYTYLHAPHLAYQCLKKSEVPSFMELVLNIGGHLPLEASDQSTIDFNSAIITCPFPTVDTRRTYYFFISLITTYKPY